MTYKLLDWRGKLPGQPWSNIGSGPHKPGRKVIHYSGPYGEMYRRLYAGEISLFDLIAWETRYQMTRGLYVPGFAVNGMMYHEVIWEDTVAIVRNADAWLYHCADGMGPDSWNKTARSIHIPLAGSVRASARTIQTLVERCDDLDRESGIGTAGRKLTLGHKEISATACPGTLMSDFVYPYRAGTLQSKPAYKPAELAKYNIVHNSTPWGRARAEFLASEVNKRKLGLAKVHASKNDIGYASLEALTRYQEPGKLVCVVIGNGTYGKLDPAAKSAMLSYGPDQCDVWPAPDNGEVWDMASLIDSREPFDGVAAAYDARFGGSPKGPPPSEPTKPVDVGPYRKDSVAVINRYAKEPHGQVIAEEADRAGLDLAFAVALVDHESAGIQNIFGADWGTPGVDRVPFAHMPVTEARVKALVAHVRAGGTSNGVGLTQLTWRDFIYEAEVLGGAHIPRNQLRVGFKIIRGYLDSYPVREAIGAYNAGPGNRRSVLNTYVPKVEERVRVWRKRLAK